MIHPQLSPGANARGAALHYYNENDPSAAAWLRQLIADGVIPAGDVDTRSIVEVQPDDVRHYTQCHWFAGIGGWAEALRLAGWGTTRAVWTGSCPCQPFSSAGKQKGHADARHLWPEMSRLVRECRPSIVFGEQVESAVRHGWLDGVFADLEAAGYACGAIVLGAHSVGSPNIRQRLYWVADAIGSRDVYARRIATDGAERGMQTEDGERQRIRLDAGEHGDACGLADAEHGRSTGKESRAESWTQSRGMDSGMENAAHAASARFRQQQHELSRAAGGAGPGRMAHANITELRGLPSAGEQPEHEQDAGNCFWSVFSLIPCRDGKQRRTQPGIFPLAHGVQGRVGLLRGYGNAINAYTAAAFIEAVMAERTAA